MLLWEETWYVFIYVKLYKRQKYHNKIPLQHTKITNQQSLKIIFLKYIPITDVCFYIQCGAVLTRSIFSKILTIDTTYSRARYGVSFVSSKYDLYSGAVITILCAISWHIVPRYNGTALYKYGNFVMNLVFPLQFTLLQMSSFTRL